MTPRLLSSTLALLGLSSTSCAWSADVQLNLDLPANGKRPYVAVWLENASSHAFAGNIAVWYDMRKPRNIGATKWLPDLRSWWKISGSQASFPLDGVSGATRPAGEHMIPISTSDAAKNLAPGDYEVVVEVAREHGGHDLVRLPLAWPPRASSQVEAHGREELGTVRLTSKP